VVLAAVALTGLTGCADRPNNLETYYDKPADSAAPPTASPAPSKVPAGNQVGAGSPAQEIASAVAAAVLSQDDLAQEGVHSAVNPAPKGACFEAVPAGDPRGASWLYNSGSSLNQQVTGYLDRTASDVLASVQCTGQKLTLPQPSGVDGMRGWCASGTCTVLLASGHVLSGLQVTASTTTRASDAIRSLVPIAAQKLATT
jgi:hypothetical protein